MKSVILFFTILASVQSFMPSVLSNRAAMVTSLKMSEVVVTAKMVSQLRAKTDAPMMECKKALIESKGDFEKVIKLFLCTFL